MRSADISNQKRVGFGVGAAIELHYSGWRCPKPEITIVVGWMLWPLRSGQGANQGRLCSVILNDERKSLTRVKKTDTLRKAEERAVIYTVAKVLRFVKNPCDAVELSARMMSPEQ